VVRKEYGVGVRDVLPQKLLPEVRRGVNKDSPGGSRNEYAASQPFESRIFRLTDLALTAYHRDSGRRTGSEEHKFSAGSIHRLGVRHSAGPIQVARGRELPRGGQMYHRLSFCLVQFSAKMVTLHR
jgi:hypothetical protein